MQLSNAPSKIKLPFANSGTKNTIPVASQIGITAGAASYTDGFPPLTFTPVASGGVPPYGADFNGILNASTAIDRWFAAGAGFVYDSAFATDSNVGGYPKGARVLRTDGEGYWLNIADNNTTNPESGGAGWVPDFTSGSASIVMTSSSVTLTSLEAGRPVIVITGTLTANLNLIFPGYVKSWQIINLTTGSFTITAKTSSGVGVIVNKGVATQVVSDGTDFYFINRSVGFSSPVSVLASRAINTNYTNTTGVPLFVHVRGISTSATASSITLTNDGILNQSTTVNVSASGSQICGIIKPGGVYSITVTGTMNITEWNEQ